MPYATRQGIINFPKRKLITQTSRPVKNVNETPESKSPTLTPSSSARKAFHNSISAGIVGREKELKNLSNFLLEHLKNETSGSMYISGLPGTGKTASVNYVIEKNDLSKKYHIVKINCTSFNSSSAFFKRLCESLKLRTVKKTEKESISAIDSYILRKHKMILLILDEIDQLESKSQSVLYKIFEWPSWENSKFVLIGISNAMDLTDRNLPRLCAKVELKPVLLHFSPYTKSEIIEILKSRLAETGTERIFAPGAIEFIAAKVAGTSGDVRRALDLGKRVIEIAEQKHQRLHYDDTFSPEKIETNKCVSEKSLKRKVEENFSLKRPSELQTFSDNIVESANCYDSGASPRKCSKMKINERVCLEEITPQKCNIPSSSSLDHKMPLKSPRRRPDILQFDSENSVLETNQLKSKCPVLKKSQVKALKEDVDLRISPRKLEFDVDSKDVLTVVKNVFVSKNFKTNEESSFPLHQKLLICSLLLIMKKGKKNNLNVGKLHQVYSKVCAKRGLTAVDKSGFLFLCRQVEVSGVLQIGKGEGALAKIALQWDESEVVNALQDLNLMSSILNDMTCLT